MKRAEVIKAAKDVAAQAQLDYFLTEEPDGVAFAIVRDAFRLFADELETKPSTVKNGVCCDGHPG